MRRREKGRIHRTISILLDADVAFRLCFSCAFKVNGFPSNHPQRQTCLNRTGRLQCEQVPIFNPKTMRTTDWIFAYEASCCNAGSSFVCWPGSDDFWAPHKQPQKCEKVKKEKREESLPHPRGMHELWLWVAKARMEEQSTVHAQW